METLRTYRKFRTRDRIAVVLVLVALATTFASLGSDAFGAGKVPPGNKGTVKIDNEFFDGIPNNVPHPGCDFHLQFFHFPRETTATYTFTMHPPTADGSKSGSVRLDPASDPNADIVIHLRSFLLNSGVTPHPIQGFHVKLTIHAPGAIGADVKHKVFWIECEESSPPPSSTPPPSPKPKPTPPETPPVTPPAVTPPPTVTPPAVTPPTRVSGRRPTKVLGKRLAQTGSGDPGKLALTGLMLVVVGFLFVWMGRTRKIETIVLTNNAFADPYLVDVLTYVERSSPASRGPPRGPP